jgi:hypothetical protein
MLQKFDKEIPVAAYFTFYTPKEAKLVKACFAKKKV